MIVELSKGFEVANKYLIVEFITSNVQSIGNTGNQDYNPVKYELGKTFQKEDGEYETLRLVGATMPTAHMARQVEAKKSTYVHENLILNY